MEERTNKKNAEIKHLKLALGRFRKYKIENINKITTMLIGMTKVEMIFFSKNKSIVFNNVRCIL